LIKGAAVNFKATMADKLWAMRGVASFARLSAADLLNLVAGKALIGNATTGPLGVLNDLALTNASVEVAAANYPTVFDTASMVLEGVSVYAKTSLSLPAPIQAVMDKIGLPASKVVRIQKNS
jgi:hypothetical protein